MGSTSSLTNWFHNLCTYLVIMLYWFPFVTSWWNWHCCLPGMSTSYWHQEVPKKFNPPAITHLPIFMVTSSGCVRFYQPQTTHLMKLNNIRVTEGKSCLQSAHFGMISTASEESRWLNLPVPYFLFVTINDANTILQLQLLIHLFYFLPKDRHGRRQSMHWDKISLVFLPCSSVSSLHFSVCSTHG